MKKTAILLTLCAALLLSACGGAVRTPAPTASPTPSPAPKPMKDGFDPETNFTVTIGDMDFSVPGYFTPGNNKEGANPVLYSAENGVSIALIMLGYGKYALSQASFTESRVQFITNLATGMTMKLTGEVYTLTAAGMDGVAGPVSFEQGGKRFSGTIVCFNEPDTMIHYGILLQTDNTLYDYTDDFWKIVFSAEKAPAAAPSATEAPASGTVSPELKKFLDEYEAFMDEYVAFMKSFKAGTTDMNLLMKYSTLLTKYSKFAAEAEALDTSNMSSADYAYYIDVMARVNKKLLEIVG